MDHAVIDFDRFLFSLETIICHLHTNNLNPDQTALCKAV